MRQGHVRLKDRQGVVLISVLGVIIFLAVISVSLAQRVRMETVLNQHWIGQLKSDAALHSGLVYGIYHLQSNGVDSKFKNDSIKNIEISDGVNFDLGFSGEENKINLNALNVQNYGILTYLITLSGFDKDLAETIATAVVDWHDADDSSTKADTESQYYQALNSGYLCKNAPFDQIEELLFVKGMTPEIYGAIKDFITVYPSQGDLKININTASEIVLESLLRFLVDTTPGIKVDDIKGMMQKLINYRNGSDHEFLTKDDRTLPTQGDIKKIFDFSSPEASLYAFLQYRYAISTTQFIRMKINSVDEPFKVQSRAEAVLKRDDLSIVFWHRE